MLFNQGAPVAQCSGLCTTKRNFLFAYLRKKTEFWFAREMLRSWSEVCMKASLGLHRSTAVVPQILPGVTLNTTVKSCPISFFLYFTPFAAHLPGHVWSSSLHLYPLPACDPSPSLEGTRSLLLLAQCSVHQICWRPLGAM